MDIVLYYAPITCALAPYITLTEAGTKFEVRPLNLRKGQHTSAEYLKINPKHKVPVLIVDGKILSESVAIQTWIARTFPQARLLPADPWQELQAISLMSWCSGGIHPFVARINSPPKVCGVPGTEDSVKKLAAENLMELFKIADDPRIHGELLKLGIAVGQTTVAKYMGKRRRPPSQGWKTFLHNHADGIAAMDLFVVPTISAC